MTSLTDYQAAKSRVERFMGGEAVWDVYSPRIVAHAVLALRADLNIIAEHEAGQMPPDAAALQASYKQGWNDREDDLMLGVTRVGAPQAPAIDARTYLMGCALTGLLVEGRPAESAAIALAITDAALAALNDKDEDR